MNSLKLESIKQLLGQFTNGNIKYPHQLERKVAVILELPKGYSQELYYERLALLSSQTIQEELNS